MAHPNVRRVVTGHDFDGKARVVADDAVEPITSGLMPGCAIYRLWGGTGGRYFPTTDRRAGPRRITRRRRAHGS